MGAAFTGNLLDTEAQGQARPSLWCPLSSPQGRSSCAEATPPAGHPSAQERHNSPLPCPRLATEPQLPGLSWLPSGVDTTPA